MKGASPKIVAADNEDPLTGVLTLKVAICRAHDWEWCGVPNANGERFAFLDETEDVEGELIRRVRWSFENHQEHCGFFSFSEFWAALNQEPGTKNQEPLHVWWRVWKAWDRLPIEDRTREGLIAICGNDPRTEAVVEHWTALTTKMRLRPADPCCGRPEAETHPDYGGPLARHFLLRRNLPSAPGQKRERRTHVLMDVCRAERRRILALYKTT